jgi:hypothetical protein
MKNLGIPVLIGMLFSAIGLVLLIMMGQVLTAAIWLSFGNGLILSTLRFTKVDNSGQPITAPVPTARFYAGILLILMAGALLLLQIFQDIK